MLALGVTHVSRRYTPCIEGLGIVKVRIFKTTFLRVLWILPAQLRRRGVPRGQLSVLVSTIYDKSNSTHQLRVWPYHCLVPADDGQATVDCLYSLS